MLGGVVDLQSLGQGERLGRVERLLPRADGVGVEVVHDQDDLLGVGVVAVQESFDLVGPVGAGASRQGFGATPSGQGLGP